MSANDEQYSHICESTAEQGKYRLHLEELVKERTAELDQAIAALQRSLREIGETQAKLAKSEKMAALGGLVAGVAHEINTPIGIGVTALSFLEDETERMRKRLSVTDIGKRDFERFMDTVSEISTNVLSNLKRAANLVSSFKQVAVDQSTEARRTVRIARYIDETLLTLIPKYKKASHRIKVDCPPDLEIETYPGAISQIVTNLVMNSLIHGFEGIDEGEISFLITENESGVCMQYRDDGRGMDKVTLERSFEHFFTTNREHGGTGLGLNIVYNLVTHKLSGTITCISEPGGGVVYTLCLPGQIAEDNNDSPSSATADSGREKGDGLDE